MKSVKSDSVCVMLGKRNTGKSYLVKDLLSYHSDIPAGIVISPTESSNQFYGNIFPPLFIYDEYDPAVIAKFVKRQKQATKKANSDSRYDPRAVCVLDDCLADCTWHRDKNMRHIFLNGRHSHILFLLTSQYPLGIPPTMRSNIDFVFILRENIVKNRKIIYENYCGMLPSFDAFCAVLDQTTEDYECLVVNNTTKSNKISDQIFYYKADEAPPFQIGSREMWALNNKLLGGMQDSDDEDDGPLEGRGDDPKKLRVLVRKVPYQ